MPKPTRSPTHAAIDTTRLMKLSGDLDDIAEDDVITPEAIDELAEENGVERSHYYAALPLTDYRLAGSSGPTAVVCVGGCQAWGAIDCLEALLDARDQGGEVTVQVRECLDQCEKAAAIELRTEGGTALIAAATPASIRDALGDLSS